MRRSIYISLMAALPCTGPALAQQHYNMVKTMKAVKPVGTGNAALPSNGIVTIQYYDGLGRPEQEVVQGVTPQGRDLVTLHEYDGFGRESRTWLPVAASSGNGGRPMTASSVSSQTSSFYGDAAAYSYNVYEPSVLNRPLEQYGPGKAWHDNGKSIKTEYLKCENSKAELACRLYKVSADRGVTSVTLGGYYADNSLAVTKTTDEDGRNTVLEFKDNGGRTVLTRKISGNGSLDTYYVYDIYGNLRAVLPPSASAEMASGDSWTETDGAVARYAYLYKYDGRNRMTGKKLPGTGWYSYYYDGADRMIFSQTPVQAGKSPEEYTFILYDDLDRVVMEGRCRSACSYGTPVRTALSCSTSGAVYASGISQSGYTAGIALDSPSIDKVFYYDNYNLYMLQGFAAMATPQTKCDATGLLSATRTAVNDGSGKYVYAMNFYDRYGRVVETVSTNAVGGTDNVRTAYTFTGNPLTVTVTHTSKYSKESRTLTYRYSYDSADRLLAVTLSDGNAMKTIKSLEYDELGRIRKDGRTGSPSLATDYAYDLRSRMTSGSNPNFSSTLKYTYGGNISEMRWKGPTDTDFHIYNFEYDRLNRLSSAKYSTESCSDNLYGTQYIYDNMGNFKQLTRYGRVYNSRYSCADMTWYTYDGNHLVKAYCSMSGNSYYGAMHFRNGADEDIEYFYDSNGNTVKDLNRGITGIEYDVNNLPVKVTFKDGSTISTVYDADGNKLSVTHHTALKSVKFPLSDIMPCDSMMLCDSIRSDLSDASFAARMPRDSTLHDMSSVLLERISEKTVTDYSGSFIYRNGTLDKILFDGGYITYSGGSATYHFYIQDHLGSTRAVVTHSGVVEQTTHYYPFGAINGAISTGFDVQPYKYNGKELDRTNGYDMMDYGARMYAADLGRWMVMDPLAEKYYDVSPYVYCGNDPVNYIDPDGRDDYKINQMGTIEFWRKTNAKSTHRIFSGNSNITIERDLVNQLVANQNGQGTSAITTNSDDAFKFFKFAADNTKVEWSLVGVKTNSGNIFKLRTDFEMGTVCNDTRNNKSMLFHLHNHPWGSNLSETKASGNYKEYQKIPQGKKITNSGSDLLTLNNIYNDYQEAHPNYESNRYPKAYIYYSGDKKQKSQLYQYDLNRPKFNPLFAPNYKQILHKIYR